METINYCDKCGRVLKNKEYYPYCYKCYIRVKKQVENMNNEEYESNENTRNTIETIKKKINPNQFLPIIYITFYFTLLQSNK